MPKVSKSTMKDMEILEMQFAASILWYDQEEMDNLIEMWDSITGQKEFQYNANFDLFVQYCAKIKMFDYDTAESRRAHTIDKILVSANQNPNLTAKEAFLMWFERVQETEVNLELSEDIFYHYCWEQHKILIDQIDKSNIDFKEKLEVKPALVERISSNGIMTIDDIDEYDEDLAVVYTTGIPELDEFVNPKNGNFVVIAARPGVGKSLFMLNMAIANANKGLPVLFVNMEMTPQQIQGRICSNISGEQVKTAKDITAIKKDSKYDNIKKYLHIYKNEYKNTASLINKLDEMIAENDYKIIFIDYLQLLRYANTNDWDSLRRLTLDLKQLAFRNNVLVVSASQVARSSTESGLNLTDLFGSSSIESDTDMVIGMESFTETRFNDGDSIINIKVLKNREGQLKQMKFRIDYSISSFTVM